jgi:hypothetical protein
MTGCLSGFDRAILDLGYLAFGLALTGAAAMAIIGGQWLVAKMGRIR